MQEKVYLDQIVQSVRKIINDNKMINKCDACQGIIGRYLKKQCIEFYPCSTNKVISNNVTGHSFIVALIGENYYVIDPSFIQFKYIDNEKVIINGMRCKTKSPYYYLSNIDKDLLNDFITNGYFELTEKSAYAYGNAFYFTKTAIPSTMKLDPIEGNVWIKAFKKGNDTLSNYNIGEIEFESSEIIKK